MSYEPPCTVDPEMWFSTAQAEVRAAQEACFHCKIREPCRDLAFQAEGEWNSRRFGIFGGLTPEDRSRIHTQSVRQARDKRKKEENE